MKEGSRALAGTYMVLTMLGGLLPLAAFFPWLVVEGLNVPKFFADLFSNPVGSFFGLDVIISATVLTLFVAVQGKRDGVRLLWLPIAAIFLAGVSCGLPLFLAMREIRFLRR